MKIAIENNEVVIRIPIPEKLSETPLSKSGKNHVLDTTHGFTTIAGTKYKVAVNLIISAKDVKRPVDVVPLKSLWDQKP